MGQVCSNRAVTSLQAKDRHTGEMIDEMVPAYLRSIYVAMYQNPAGRIISQSSCIKGVLKKATGRHGRLMDTKESADNIPQFIDTYRVNVHEADRPLGEYSSFNDFFSRKLKPGSREIHSQDNHDVCVSPADCRAVMYPSLETGKALWLKGQDFTVEELLGDSHAHLAPQFEDCAVMIARLAPNDYHRWHMPCTGKLGARALVGGEYYSVSPRAVTNFNVLATNKRMVCPIDSEAFGQVIMIPIGAAMVAGMTITAKEGAKLRKGDEHGYFSMGGSTVVLLFRKGSIVFDEDLVKNSVDGIETIIRMGDRIGESTA